jgi:hypothetical protein
VYDHFPAKVIQSLRDSSLNWDHLKTLIDFGTDFLDTDSVGPDQLQSDLNANVEEWISVSFSNSWVDFGGGFATTQYRKDPWGVVHIKGAVKNGSSASANMFTLPVGYRPTETLDFPNVSNAGLAQIRISTGGVVNAVGGGSTTVTFLNGITFFTD